MKSRKQKSPFSRYAGMFMWSMVMNIFCFVVFYSLFSIKNKKIIIVFQQFFIFEHSANTNFILHNRKAFATDLVVASSFVERFKSHQQGWCWPWLCLVDRYCRMKCRFYDILWMTEALLKNRGWLTGPSEENIMDYSLRTVFLFHLLM